MKSFKEILAHCTGISSPIFGVQWNPPILEIQVARDLVTDLEDRRVLFSPVAMEGPSHCLASVNSMRQSLTNALKQLSESSLLAKQLLVMRKACHHFADVIGAPGFDNIDHVFQRSVLERELFALRKAVGKALSEIVVAHGLNVEDDLATIIPYNYFAKLMK
jgi:hypothetical protein